METSNQVKAQGTIDLALHVYCENEEADLPEIVKVSLTPERIKEIRDLAGLVRLYKHLDMVSVRLLDLSTQWYQVQYEEDNDNFISTGNPVPMEWSVIVIDDSQFWYEAQTKGGNDLDSEIMQISSLRMSE